MTEVTSAVENFLQERPTLTLGTLKRDGSPQASVLWYLWDRGEFVMSTVQWTAKWHNLKRDPRCSICVEEPISGQMVVAYGNAVLQADGVRPRTHDIVDRYYDDSADTESHMDRIFATDDRVLISVRPATLITRHLD